MGMEALARLINDSVPRRQRAVVGIDGVDGSGKSSFAEALARRVTTRPVVLIHLDHFLNPASIRHRRGRTSPEGFWLDSYDYDALAAYALRPLRADGDGRYRARSYDLATDTAVRPPLRQAPQDALVVVEGMFLHRDGLTDVWDYSVFLDVPFHETVRRMAERDGSNPDPEHESMRRYVEGQRIYFATARPWERASLVIENSDPDRPYVIAADSVGPR